jgi:gas vesicle protein
MKKTISNFLLGFLAGAAAGAIAGILFAPEKGSATRQNIKKKVRDLSDEYGLGLSELIDEMGIEPETEYVPNIRKRKQAARTTEQPQPKKRKYTRKKPSTND